MQSLRITIEPESAFGTSLKGDTLFGQICWMLFETKGQQALENALQGYTNNQPFLICSDGFPSGYLPRPEYPLAIYNQINGDRKQIKKRQWISLGQLSQPVETWLGLYQSDKDIINHAFSEQHMQQHNSINRKTGTTGEEGFAPYQMSQHWYADGLKLDIWLLIDEQKLSTETVIQLLENVGATGYGRDASIGLGKFTVSDSIVGSLYKTENANTLITLAPSVLSSQHVNTEKTYYSIFTRFGRHGGQAIAKQKPFKNPVLMANTAAVVVPEKMHEQPYIGKGLGGSGELSKAIPATVQQAYAPCIKIHHQGL